MGMETKFQSRGVIGECPRLFAFGDLRIGGEAEAIVTGFLPLGEADLERLLFRVSLGMADGG